MFKHVFSYVADRTKFYKSDRRDEVIKILPDQLKDIGERSHSEYIKHLLKWFKSNFFKWFDLPTCEKCGTKEHIEYTGFDKPSEQEFNYGAAHFTEVHTCKQCGDTDVRFPRYDDPFVILK